MSAVKPISESNIVSFFHDKNIFLTGGTGFVGKCLIEKLLRSCPGIKGIYVLVRQQKGLTPAERTEKLCASRLFDTIRATNSDFTKIIHPIEGDLRSPNFGLSTHDEEMLIEKCHIVFHSAATVRFDEPLKTALEINLLGVKKMVHLCSKMRSLQSFVHVSTAYSNCNRQCIDEIIYDNPFEPEKLLSAAEWMDEDMLDLITDRLLNKFPNTYAFTKGLAETYLASHAKHLPLAIIRPSIIGSTWREPIPGFVDNYMGPSGVLAAYLTGLLRVWFADTTVKPNIIPVDIVVNMMIVISWYTWQQTNANTHISPSVFNCCAGDEEIVQSRPTSEQWLKIASEQVHSHSIGYQCQFRWPRTTITLNKDVCCILHL
ncbi:unnamed protein product [Adineta steineri]|uniref:Fatty acyl-CoA reductase n=1 Tax=Adineta steineri TaxID=433720 RepID=A0A814HGV6_9BILA|nr:unnamed protein product [Adineta steineri]